jgi:hypothetical protein
MIWHHHELMEEEVALVATEQNALHQSLSVLLNVKDGSVLPGFCRDKVGAAGSDSMSQSAHSFSGPQGLKPLNNSLQVVGAKAPTP